MGGSGGGGSGRSDWPDYMKAQHQAWLTAIASAIVTGITANPYAAINAFQPDVGVVATAGYLGDMQTKFAALLTKVTTPSDPGFADMLTHSSTGFVKKVTTILDATALSSTYLSNAMLALSDDLTMISSKAIGLFEAGMQDINAALTSSFVIGEMQIAQDIFTKTSVWEGELLKDLAKARASGIVTLAGGLLDSYKQWLDVYRGVAALAVDMDRISIIAKSEEVTENMTLDSAAATWPFELYMYGIKMLGGMSGASAVSTGKPPSKAQSALAGAVAGASAGAMTGNPYVAAAGAVIGGIAGYVSG